MSGVCSSTNYAGLALPSLSARSNTASVTVTIQPAPIAANDTATLQANKSVMIPVLANDTSSGGTR
jgi:hypothetical protein